MKEKHCLAKSYNELPLILRPKEISEFLGIGINTAREIFHAEGFPRIEEFGGLSVEKYAFMKWLQKRSL
jgi:hypothetical protein